MNKPNLTPDERLQELLREARPTVTLAPGFQDRVWRRVERVEQESTAPSANWLTRLASQILQPRLAGAFALVMVLLGAGIGAAQGEAAARQAAQARYLSYIAPSPVR